MNMLDKPPLIRYVIGVIIVWAILLYAMRFKGGGIHFRTFAIFCGGFLMGMLAMYIAVHLYSWK
jgi:hypothetical protein